MHPQDRLFCEIAVQLQLLTRQQATSCMQAQEREAVGQSVASIAMAFGYMDQVAVDTVLHQQQRVLDRRREAREASRAQREVESRAAAGLGHYESGDPAGTPTQRPPASRQPGGSGVPPRQSLAPRASFAPGARQSDEVPPRYSDSWSEAPHAIDDTRETLDERPPMRVGHAPRDAEEADPRRTKPLAPAPSSSIPAARSVAEAVLAASYPSSRPPSAAARGARGALLESAEQVSWGGSGFPPQQRELSMPPRSATGRPIPSVRDWRNPSRPPPATESFEGDTPLQPVAARRSSRPPAVELHGRSTLRAPAGGGVQHVERALELCAQHGASDYHLHSGALPRLRIDGRMHMLAADQPVSDAAVEQILAEVLTDAERMQLTLDGELRVIHETESGIRARLHAIICENGPHLQLHVLPIDVPSPALLGLGPALRVLSDKPWGLAICSGPAGSGITTTQWSLAQALCAERSRHIVSLENPIELNVQCGVGVFEQREVTRHVESYAEGIRWAIAEGADIVVVADMLAPGAFEASLHASRARCLVLGGVRAGGSFAALRRLMSQAQGDPEIVRRELADGLRLLLHQRLVPRREPPGRVAAFELVVGSTRLTQHVRRAELLQLAAAFESSAPDEVLTLRDALHDLVASSVISADAMRAVLGVDRRCLEG